MRTSFIIGPPRSGTTLLLDLMRKHRGVLACGESFHRFHHDLTLFRDRVSAEDHFHLTTQDATPAIRAAYQAEIERQLTEQRREHFVLKISTLSMQVDYVAALFPEARFVQLVRDPRDTACSMEDLRQHLETQQGHPRALGPAPDPFGLWCASQGYPGHLRALASWVFHVTHSLVDLRFLGGDRFLRVRYEDLVARPVETLNAILQFLELGPEPKLLAAAEAVVDTPGREGGLGFSTTQSASGRRLRRFEAELDPALRSIAAGCLAMPMQVLGYTPDPIPTARERDALGRILALDLGEWWPRAEAEERWFTAEWLAFAPERLLREADEPTPTSRPYLIDGACVGTQQSRVQGTVVESTSFVAKQARRCSFADPTAIWPQVARCLNGEATVAELASRFSLGAAGQGILARLHCLGFVAYR